MDVVCKLVENHDEFAAALQVRFAVFVGEQNIPPEEEIDQFDAEALHVIVYQADQVIGTGRLVREGKQGKIGRVAVLRPHRGQGVGKKIMEFILDLARVEGMERVHLHAQTHALEFYRKLGFAPSGEPFDECGIEHIEMAREIDGN